MRDLEGRVAYVTGAASGIGFGIATALAQAGVKVMLCDIESETLDAAVARLSATNADVAGICADVSLKDNLQAAADATIARFGKVHIVVNNAGVGGGGSYGSWQDGIWRWTLDVNVMSVVWGVEIFGPLLESHGEGGHIVSTASIAGLLSGSGAPYNVSKYGVVALSEGLRVELAPRGIGVSVLCPGIIRTAIMDSDRNMQARYGTEAPGLQLAGDTDQEAFMKDFRARIEAGIDPLYVGELVREGIEEDWDYIFTDNEFEPLVEMRFAAIKAAFERIRDRKPRY
jgi:NAD(P)-dependent dehydrogenase (short-subunit alcohol dehydrogenase family)